MRKIPFRASLATTVLACSTAAAEGTEPPANTTEASVLQPALSTPTRATGIVMLDYRSIGISGYPSIDLFGFHFLNRFSDWLYLGVGGHAPLVQGEYGGFMAFDGTVHLEHRLYGRFSAFAGASLGGGGGGKSVAQSKVISGSGGFVKAYLGAGYRFDDWTLDLDYSKVRITHSAIDHSQFGLSVQVPFSYALAPYDGSGSRGPGASTEDRTDRAPGSDDDIVVLGLDNIVQIDPKASFRGTVNLVDAQYDHFLTDNVYVLFGGSVGYHGLAAYNQVFGGLGYRYRSSKRLNLYAQLGIGSGGYAPEKIDTGPGWLVYPKLSAEYLLSDKIGVQVSGGYLAAPRGSSRNVTLGAALVYHVSPSGTGAFGATAAQDVGFGAHRFHLFPQTEFKVKVGDRDQGAIRLLTLQVDNTIGDNLYLPLQGSIAYNSYLGYPGYGEVAVGLGLQNKYVAGDRFQAFAQFLVGTNVHGLIAKPAVGLNLGLSDRLAMYAQVGATASLDDVGVYPKQYRFRAINAGLGLTYRFALANP